MLCIKSVYSVLSSTTVRDFFMLKSSRDRILFVLGIKKAPLSKYTNYNAQRKVWVLKPSGMTLEAVVERYHMSPEDSPYIPTGTIYDEQRRPWVFRSSGMTLDEVVREYRMKVI